MLLGWGQDAFLSCVNSGDKLGLGVVDESGRVYLVDATVAFHAEILHCASRRVRSEANAKEKASACLVQDDKCCSWL
jgi:hypothetical protein